MSNHLLQRLNIAREDPSIRQALPPGSFRTQQQAAVEARMRHAAAMSKMLSGSAAGAAAGSAAAGPSATSSPVSASARPRMSLAQGGGGGGAAAGYAGGYGAPAAGGGMVLPRGLRQAPAAPSGPSGPRALPHVFRRARQTVQISDPTTGDLLQLDAGTWVLTDAGADPSTNALKIYTTDADSGAVMAYDIPMGSGAISDYFDLHTFNPLETAGPAADAATAVM